MVMNSGNGDRGRVQMQVGSQQRLSRRKDRNRIVGRSLFRACGVGFDGRHQSHAQASRFQLAIDAQMVAPKGSGTGNSDSQVGFDGYCPAPFPSTVFRQRL